MQVIRTPAAVSGWSAQIRSTGERVGFVPTMGALHEGHLDLVTRAKAQCDRVVCSIFVNPLQFNNPEDLERYPRSLAEDQVMLERVGCDALFAPVKEEIFSDFTPTQYELGRLDQCWEGPSRPGHFQGVVNVVERLFFFVRPDAAFFGEKDRQQLAIIQYIAQHLHWPERIVPCPTVRAADGLALSSRNLRLDPSQRRQATVLNRALQLTSSLAFKVPLAEATNTGMALLRTELGERVDYFGIADPTDLSPLEYWGDHEEAIALVAAHVGPVRLIDNLTLHR